MKRFVCVRADILDFSLRQLSYSYMYFFCVSHCIQIEMILNKIGLVERENVYAGELSGGEMKRLSVALELLDDPKILFIDECTTGLDSVTSTQCLQLLKNISKEGRTIVTSIHQPSALNFKMFDHIFALAQGSCIYQGSSENLVAFLNDLDLTCPTNYNPSDFLLEIANNDYGPQNHRLRNKVEIRSIREAKSAESQHAISTNVLEIHTIKNEISQLLKRNLLNNYRDKTFTIMRILIHLIMALFIGVMYSGIGQEGAQMLNTYKFLFFNIFILVFTGFSSLQTSCKIKFNFKC
jgi:ATP-binding cassette subfamily G (WHITE) protein 1